MRDILAPRALWRQISGWLRLPRATWIEDGAVLACRYPRSDADLRDLASSGVRVLLNLHEKPHDETRLAAFGLEQVHVPVRDFQAPTPEQIERGVAAIATAVADGRAVAVHCGAGMGRTGTMLACYFVSGGYAPDAAIAHVRNLRPGSVETERQFQAVRAYAASLSRDGRPEAPSA